MTVPKRRGRPPKPKSERAVSVNFTMRLRPKLMDELRQSAEAADLTISGEAERRLSHPAVDEVGRMISLVIAATEQREGKSWKSDAATRTKCRLAVDVVINTMLGPPVPVARVKAIVENSQPLIDKIEKGEPLSVLDLLLTGGEVVRSADALKEMASVLEEAANVQAVAEEKLREQGLEP